MAGGMLAVWLKKPNNRVVVHFSFMYWSVLGLYAAFASEIAKRIPETPSFGMAGLAAGNIMLVGGAYFYWRKACWATEFG